MLSGNLELFALADVLRFVARSGATGSVNIYRPVDAGRVLLVEGHVAGAVVDDTPAADEDGVVDAVVRLMDGGGGDFALELEPVAGPTRQPVEELLQAVGRRRAEWRKILGSVGSLDGALEVSALIPTGSAEITLTPLEWHIAVLVDGRRSLREIAREAEASEFAAATALLAMSNAGLLVLAGAPSAEGGAGDLEESDDAGSEEGFDYDDEVVEAEDDPDTSDADADVDPADLLRELGDQAAPRRPGRRMGPVPRREQQIRLR